ncbi:MAG: hypothetical protein AAF638_06800, partial [Pseudomonadota bacterium]
MARSIQTRLALLMVAVVSVTLAGIVGSLLHGATTGLWSVRQDGAEATARILAANASQAVYDDNKLVTRQALRAVNGLAGDGATVTVTRRSREGGAFGRFVSVGDGVILGVETANERPTVFDLLHARPMVAKVPVRFGGRTVGDLTLSLPTADLRQQTLIQIAIAFFVAFGAGLVG